MIHHAWHDAHLVMLSIAIAILGSYTALDLFRRVRVNTGRSRSLWLAVTAIAMGLSIWSMHFVAMLAFHIGLPVAYDVGLTALSLLVAIGVTGVAFIAAARPRPRRAHVLAAGLFMGLGISGMHYLGMAAMRLPATLTYDTSLVALSLLIAVGASTAALVLALREPSVSWQVAGAMAAGLAISGMHYVAMAAAIFSPTGGGAVDAPGLNAPALALTVAAATFATLCLALVAASFDRRFARLALEKAAELERRVRERTRELAEANARLRAVVESLPFDLWVCDRAGRYVLQNSAARRNWGDRLDLRPEETGSPPELVARWVEHNARALAGETVRGEESHTIAGGELRHVEKVLAPIESEGEVLGCVNVNIDVTERKTALDTLKESKERLQLAIEATGLGIWDVDSVSGKRHWSPEFKAILGLPPDASPDPELYAALIHPDDREAVVARYRRAYESGRGGRYEAEHRIRRADDGAERWVHATGRVCFDRSGRAERATGTLKDVTERRRAHEALRESEERYRALVETSPDAVFVHRGGTIVLANRQAAALFGAATPEALAGRPVFELVDRASLPLARERTAALSVPGQRVGLAELTYRRLDGTTFPVEADAAAVLIDGRLAIQVVFRDLSAKERMERELRQAQKMEAVGQLTGGLAHDFNNLLAVIIGNLDLAAETARDSTIREPIEEALGAAQRGAELTRALLAFSRQQPLQPRAVAVADLVTSLRGLLQRALGERVVIETKLAPNLGPALADPAQLEAALLNLAVNARDAMAKGGRLVIETADSQLDHDYAATHREVVPGRYLLIAVSDSGAGMSAETVRRAFEPFFTTKGPGKGSGLGLSMVHGFAKQSGGHVSIYSEQGFGTTVRLYLPYAQPAAEAGEVQGRGAERAAGEAAKRSSSSRTRPRSGASSCASSPRWATACSRRRTRKRRSRRCGPTRRSISCSPTS